MTPSPNDDSALQLINLSDGKLTSKSVTLLSDIPPNVFFTPTTSLLPPSPPNNTPPSLFHSVKSTSHRGGFLGFQAKHPSYFVTTSIGGFNDRSFLSIFRFKTWWSTQWVGNSGSDIQPETQWILLDIHETNSYALILPIIDGKFRSSLHPGDKNSKSGGGELMIIGESGSTQVKESLFKAIAYVHVGENPYSLMKEAFAVVRVHLGTFRLLEEKSTPSLIDKFGWCTWDAFYLLVDPVGVAQGVEEFYEGGLPVRFVIIDDGWQSINRDDDDDLNCDAAGLIDGGEQMTARLHRLDEGDKFRQYRSGTILGKDCPRYDPPSRPREVIFKARELARVMNIRKKMVDQETDTLCGIDERIERLRNELNELVIKGKVKILNSSSSSSIYGGTEETFGLGAFTRDLRAKFRGLDDVYMWHALCGAWGGVRPGSIPDLESKIVPCVPSPGISRMMGDLAADKVVEAGIGLVHPQQAHHFYDSMHSYLANAGITGAKIDVIEALEYVGEEYDGRVDLAKAYYEALSCSMKKNFSGTNIIASMQQCNDFFFLGTNQISMARVGDDFWCEDPHGDPSGVFWLQGVHMVHCSYNSLWMGHIIHPDWDMFHTDHVCAEFHAASRAICGGPVYVSDPLGGHDFDLLRKLVHPDGTIPRCEAFALPTKDCLFKNPLSDGKTVLKIWNLNGYGGGVVGAFNCQGVRWDQNEQRFKGEKACYVAAEVSIRVDDIEWGQMRLGDEYAVYLGQRGLLCRMTRKSEPIRIQLDPTSFELFTFAPIKKVNDWAEFAPIGLVNMFNCGGTILELKYSSREEQLNEGENGNCVKMKIKGGGHRFLCYSNVLPRACFVNEKSVEFEWVKEMSKLVVKGIGWDEQEAGVSEVIVQY